MPSHRKTIRHLDEAGNVHELTFSCYQRQLLLSSELFRQQFSVALQRALDRHDFRLFAFVIMPEHVHLLVQSRQGNSSIADLLRGIKRPCSFRIKQWLEAHDRELLRRLTIQQRPGVTTFRFFQEGPGYDRNLTEPSTILSAIDYIHQNPVRRGLCERAIDWKWSSARHYLLDGSVPEPDLPRIDRIPPDVLE